MTYQVIRRTNNWNRRGDAIDVVDVTASTHLSLKQAFDRSVALTKYAGQDATYRTNAVRYFVADEDGQQIFLDALYEQVVGPLVFAALCAATGWHINLDQWLANGARA
jgi:hypothetical protein